MSPCLLRVVPLAIAVGLLINAPIDAQVAPGGAKGEADRSVVIATSPPLAPFGLARMTTGSAPTSNLSSREQKFVQDAHARGLFEIVAGQLAFQASSIQEVKLLAAHILEHRASLHEELKAFAQAKGMEGLPDELDAGTQESLELLQEASGDDDFDLRYCALVVAGHLRDIKAFQSEADNGTDPELRKLAATVASNLKRQLAIALVIQRALANARNDGATISASYRANPQS